MLRRTLLSSAAALFASSVHAQALMPLGVSLFGRRRSISGAGIVTAVEILNDISIAITSPSSMSVPMQTNGSTIRIATSGTAATSAVDISKITLNVSDIGWDATGNQASRSRTIGLAAALIGPYNQLTTYQPNTGEFYFKLNDFVFNQDSTWKTTITSIDFASGWISGQPAGQVTSVIRSDTLSYFPFAIRTPTPPWKRVATGGTLAVEVIPVNAFAQNMSQVACVEAWAVDSAASVGAVTRTSIFARSPSTPNDATTKGHPVPSYALNVDPMGLVGGRVEWRWTVKPWIGPSVTSAAYGDTFPCLNTAKGLPFCYDTDASHAPIYGYLSNEQASAPSGKTLIASNLTVTTVDVTGLSTTMAGAAASGKVYADLGTLATAVLRLNKSASNLTIADPVTGGAFSYKRPTLHNDLSGGVAVCPPVAGSVLGADAGAYSVWQSMQSQASYPPGLTPFEICSESGAPSDDVRWRGQHSDGSIQILSGRKTPSRFRIRGLTLDSTGVTTNTNDIVFNGGAPTSSTIADTELAALYLDTVDCVVRNNTSIATSTAMLYQFGFAWHTRLDWQEKSCTLTAGVALVSGGLVSSIGSKYAQTAVPGFAGVEFAGLFGAKLLNVISGGTVLGNRPVQKGRIQYNVELSFDVAAMSTLTMMVLQAGYPIQNGEGNAFCLTWGTSSSATGGVGFSHDSVKVEVDGLVVQHFGSAWPNAVGGTGRFNNSYNEQGVVRINKRILNKYCAVRSWNIKGDAFVAPENATTTGGHIATAGTAAWDMTKFYFKGQVANDTVGLHGYQALQDVPIGTALTNAAYWLDTGTASTAYGQQPLRQGNSDARYQVGSSGNVASESADSSTAPSTISWLGLAWGSGGKYNQTWSNYYNNAAGMDFTPKPGGVLVNMVPAGKACSPFDMVGTAMKNDGTDAAGPLQIP